MTTVTETLSAAIPPSPDPADCDARESRIGALQAFLDGAPDATEVHDFVARAGVTGLAKLLGDLAAPAGFVTPHTDHRDAVFNLMPIPFTGKTLTGCGGLSIVERRRVYAVLVDKLGPEDMVLLMDAAPGAPDRAALAQAVAALPGGRNDDKLAFLSAVRDHGRLTGWRDPHARDDAFDGTAAALLSNRADTPEQVRAVIDDIGARQVTQVIRSLDRGDAWGLCSRLAEQADAPRLVAILKACDPREMERLAWAIADLPAAQSDRKVAVLSGLAASLPPGADDAGSPGGPTRGNAPMTMAVTSHGDHSPRGAAIARLLLGLKSSPPHFDQAVAGLSTSALHAAFESGTVNRYHGLPMPDTRLAQHTMYAFAFSGDIASRCKALAATRSVDFDASSIRVIATDSMSGIDALNCSPWREKLGLQIPRWIVDRMSPDCPPR